MGDIGSYALESTGKFCWLAEVARAFRPESRKMACHSPRAAYQLPRDTAIGPISADGRIEAIRKGLSAVNPRRTGASASAPKPGRLGFF